MPRNTEVDTGQEWSSRTPRFSHPVQNQSPYAHQDGYPTPITGSNMVFLPSSQAGPSRSRKAAAMQMEIDGMENKAREMTINEPTDGRVGVEKPCAYFLFPSDLLLTTIFPLYPLRTHSSIFHPHATLIYISTYRRRTRLYRDQRTRRRIIRHSLSLRLALAHQARSYVVSNAEWSRSKTRVDRKKTGRVEKDETRLGRWMG